MQVNVPPYTKRGMRVWWNDGQFWVDGNPMAEGFLSHESLRLLKPVELAAAYHITDPKNRESIRASGLLPFKPKRVGNENAVYVFGDINNATEEARPFGYDIWMVNTAGLRLYQDSRLQHLAAFASLEAIPADRVTLLKSAPEVSPTL